MPDEQGAQGDGLKRPRGQSSGPLGGVKSELTRRSARCGDVIAPLFSASRQAVLLKNVLDG